MKQKETAYEQIERYLDSEMGEEELAMFRQKLDSDPSLEEKITVVRDARALILQNSLIQFKEVIKSENEKFVKNQWLRRVVISSIIGVIVIAGLVWFFNRKTEKNEIPGKYKKEVEPRKVTKLEVIENVKIPEKTSDNQPENSVENLSVPKIARKKKVSGNIKADERSDLPKSLPEKIQNKDSLPGLIFNKKIESQVEEKDSVSSGKIIISDPCNIKAIDADVHSEPTCAGERKGKIVIQNITGGTPPYYFGLEKSPLQETSSFSGLGAGDYDIIIKDKDGCEKKFKRIKVIAESCKINFEFNPWSGQVWEIPEDFGTGEISIFDKAGNTIYKKKITTAGSETWNGMSSSGEINPGYYLFIIYHGDGTVNQGSITIAAK